MSRDLIRITVRQIDREDIDGLPEGFAGILAFEIEANEPPAELTGRAVGAYLASVLPSIVERLDADWRQRLAERS
jgi:hypothetical protein